MFDVSAIGELLIDFTPSGCSQKGNPIYECNPGGAPANVLAACSKLGMKTALIGKVGEDQFGNLLKKSLELLGIESKGLVLTKDYSTTLAFVHLNGDGDRSFSFYRKSGADVMLNETEINYDIIDNSKVFHFGSVSMTSDPSKTATIKAVQYAKEKCKLISYDPNLRKLLWSSLDEAKEVILSMMEYCDIVKISDEEIEFLTGTTDPAEGSEILANRYGIRLIFVTLGKNGCFYRTKSKTGRGQAYMVDTIDTTAAGDSFLGAALYKIIQTEKQIEQITDTEFTHIVDFASAMSALVTTKYGGMNSMPEIETINECMKNNKKY